MIKKNSVKLGKSQREKVRLTKLGNSTYYHVLSDEKFETRSNKVKL